MYKNYEDSKNAYVKYIKEHKARVIDAWNEIQIKCQNQPFVTDKYINWYISNLVNHHDDSKFDDIEFEPYRKYFYPTTEETDKEQIQKNMMKHGFIIIQTILIIGNIGVCMTKIKNVIVYHLFVKHIM